MKYSTVSAISKYVKEMNFSNDNILKLLVCSYLFILLKYFYKRNVQYLSKNTLIQ